MSALPRRQQPYPELPPAAVAFRWLLVAVVAIAPFFVRAAGG